MDLQVGGVSAFRVDKNDAYVGQYGAGSTKLYLNGTNGTRPFIGTSAFQLTIDMGSYNFNIARLGNNHVIFDNNGNHTLNLIANTLTRFGGQTNAFPALKRNGAALEVRLADDSGYAGLTAGTLVSLGGIQAYSTIEGYSTGQSAGFSGSVRVGSGGNNVASAILECVSTTKGFLPPRQTEAQRLAISSPAVGLIVYQTDATAGLYVYKTGGWQFIA